MKARTIDTNCARKSAVLFDSVLSEYAIVGFDDGTTALLSFEIVNDAEWRDSNIDATMEVRRTKIIPPAFGVTTYDAHGLSRGPTPTVREFKAVRTNGTTFDVQFLADYIAEDRVWFVVGDRPSTALSIYSL